MKLKLNNLQRTLLIYLYNNTQHSYISQGRVLDVYEEDTIEKASILSTLIDDTKILKENNLISTLKADSLYKITQNGIKYLEDTTQTTLTFQCDRCGDIWSPDIIDPMILHAYLTEHPNGHISVQICESCENEEELDDNSNNDWEDDWEDEYWDEVVDAHTPDDHEKP